MFCCWAASDLAAWSMDGNSTKLYAAPVCSCPCACAIKLSHRPVRDMKRKQFDVPFCCKYVCNHRWFCFHSCRLLLHLICQACLIWKMIKCPWRHGECELRKQSRYFALHLSDAIQQSKVT